MSPGFVFIAAINDHKSNIKSIMKNVNIGNIIFVFFGVMCFIIITYMYEYESIHITKNITTTNEQGEEETKKSELIVVTCGSFIADTSVSEIGSTYPLSALGNNKDFVINGLSYLGKKENNLTIRKDIVVTPYTATEAQDIIVRTIIFAVPLVIIFIGIVVWIYRKKRK